MSMSLSSISGNRQLQNLTLMLGALRSPCGALCHHHGRIMSSTPIDDIIRTLRTLPALRQLALVGLAGGLDSNPNSNSILEEGASAALVLAVAGQMGRGDRQPRVQRLELVAWEEGEGQGQRGLERLVQRARKVAPDMQVVIKRQWEG